MIEDRLYGARRIYESSPLWLRRSAGVVFARLPDRFRYGATYGEIRRLLEASRYWTAADLQAHTDQRVEEAIRSAYEQVPYYRAVMRARGLRPEHIRRVSDLQHLPLLDKDDIRNHADDLRAQNIGTDSRIYMTTGGSTGEPVGFDLQKGICRSKESAFLDHSWSTVGHRRGDRAAILRGSVLNSERPWGEDPIKRSLVLSSYHLTDAHLPEMVQQLETFRPSYLHAYPSSAAILARYLLRSGIRPPGSIRALLVSSETLRPDQRALLSEAFRCRVHAWYGHAERVVFASACAAAKGYHAYPEYGAIEIVDFNGQALPWEPGVRGEIVGTATWNRAMPLLRYRTRDIATVGTGDCPCGLPHPLLASIEGRVQEFLVADGGRPISSTALNAHSPIYDHVDQVQYRQRIVGEVELCYVPREGFCDAHERRIRSEIQEKLGPGTRLSLRAVREIPTTRSGKRQTVVQELPVDEVLAGVRPVS